MASDSISCATSVLLADGIIAHYTDTVAGLACLPKEKLIQRLVGMKQRPRHMGFILLASSLQSLSGYFRCSTKERTTIESCSTPTTWLVAVNDGFPPALMGNSDKLAIRVSKHANILSLCERVGPIVSTSANLHGQPICRQLQHVRKLFGPSIDYVHITEDRGIQKASSIIDLQSGLVIRQ